MLVVAIVLPKIALPPLSLRVIVQESVYRLLSFPLIVVVMVKSKYAEGVNVEDDKETELTALDIIIVWEVSEVIPAEEATMVKVPFDNTVKPVNVYCPDVVDPVRVPENDPEGVNDNVIEYTPRRLSIVVPE